MKRLKKERLEMEGSGVCKRQRRQLLGKGEESFSPGSSIQSLLTAASLLEGGQSQEHRQLWDADSR